MLITVGATVIALFPLAMHGGPLWEPMCYAQIGGLTAATFITLLLVPVIYSIFVLDLKLIKWDKAEGAEQRNPTPATSLTATSSRRPPRRTVSREAWFPARYFEVYSFSVLDPKERRILAGDEITGTGQP